MGTLNERIRAELTAAMKARDALKTSTLRLLQSAVKNEQIARGRELTDDEVEAVVRRAVKQRNDSIEQYRRGNRDDLADKEEAELRILEGYLSQQLSDIEIEAMINDVIAMVGADSKKDLGKVMKEVMAQAKGRIDGRRVQEIVNRILP
ncbi:MAG TPA: GatB/YqeY domain-containing protein [Thermoanaerobaculia bacterium]|nr:GatB/YqeY domain-containing protein [Thermoanaerobaculia bacterium]